MCPLSLGKGVSAPAVSSRSLKELVQDCLSTKLCHACHWQSRWLQTEVLHSGVKTTVRMMAVHISMHESYELNAGLVWLQCLSVRLS